MTVENLTGHKLGQYELRELLGVGGMGSVYRAHQRALGRDVAVKVLPSVLAREHGYVQTFTREARIAASLEHPHIVPIYDYGTQDGIAYVVMRLLNDGTLAQRLYLRQQRREGLPSLAETSALLRQVASALDYAHRKGVVHRDMKPGNIMFDDGTPYIVDFGIARLMSDPAITGAAQVFGTPMYMPPEQWRDEELTPETDQYALAAVTYTLITGQPLFPLTQPQNLVLKHLSDLPTPPHVVRPDLPPAVSSVIGRALAKNPRDRFLTVGAFAQAFNAAVSSAGDAWTGFYTFPVTGVPLEMDSVYISQAVPQAPYDIVPKDAAPPVVPMIPEQPTPPPPVYPPPSPAVPQNAPAPQAPPARRIRRHSRGSPMQSLLLGGLIGLALLALIVCAVTVLAVNQLGVFNPDEPTETSTADLAGVEASPTDLPAVEPTDITPIFQRATPIAPTSPPGIAPTRIAALPPDNVSGALWIGTLAHGNATIRALSFSPDGATLATGAGDSAVHLWDVATETERNRFTVGAVVNDVHYSPDGSRIAASSEAGRVVVYAVGSGQIVADWQAHVLPSRGLSFSPDGSRLVTTSEDETAVVWDIATQTTLFTLNGHIGHVLDTAYSRDGARIITGGRDSTIRLWDAASGAQLMVLDGHTDEVRSVTYSPDGTQIASASADGTIRIWDAASGAPLQTMSGHNNWVWSVEFSPDGSLVVSGGRDDTAKVWDVATGALLTTLTGHGGWVIAAAFDPRGRLIATGSGDGTTRLWDVSSQ